MNQPKDQPSDQRKARILVVEDDPAILSGLSDVFVFHGHEVVAQGDGDQGLTTALSEDFDLMVLDVMLPGTDGFAICRAVREKKPGQGILMLTAKGAENDVITGFHAGADDYVTKPFSLAELMVRVQALLRRAGRSPGTENLTLWDITFCGTTLTASDGTDSVDITRREMDIVCHLAKAAGRIVSRRELLSEVWHYNDPDVETRTVDIHMQKLRKKLAVFKPEQDLVVTVRGEGYRLAVDPARGR